MIDKSHRGWGVALAALCAASLSGCSWFHHFKPGNTCNKPQPYLSEYSVPPLQVPAGIDRPDTRSALKIPQLNEPAPPPRTVKDPCLDEPPSFVTPANRHAPPAN